MQQTLGRKMEEWKRKETGTAMRENIAGPQSALGRLQDRLMLLVTDQLLNWTGEEIERDTQVEDIAHAFAVHIGWMTRLIAHQFGKDAFARQDMQDMLALMVRRNLSTLASPDVRARIAPRAIEARLARRRHPARRGRSSRQPHLLPPE